MQLIIFANADGCAFADADGCARSIRGNCVQPVVGGSSAMSIDRAQSNSIYTAVMEVWYV